MMSENTTTSAETPENTSRKVKVYNVGDGYELRYYDSDAADGRAGKWVLYHPDSPIEQVMDDRHLRATWMIKTKGPTGSYRIVGAHTLLPGGSPATAETRVRIAELISPDDTWEVEDADGGHQRFMLAAIKLEILKASAERSGDPELNRQAGEADFTKAVFAKAVEEVKAEFGLTTAQVALALKLRRGLKNSIHPKALLETVRQLGD